jgi:hypothetical protein
MANRTKKENLSRLFCIWQTIQGPQTRKSFVQRATEEAAPETAALAGAFPAQAIPLRARVGDGGGDVDARASCLLLCLNPRNQPTRLSRLLGIVQQELMATA